MHTIKGNARAHGLTFCTDTIHEIEHSYDALRNNQTAKWNQAQLLNGLELARKSVNAYADIYKNKLECFFENKNCGTMIDDILLEKIKKIAKEDGSNTASESLQQELREFLMILNTVSLTQIVQESINSLPNIAKHLGKEAPVVNIDDNNIRFTKSVLSVLQDVFMHMFRNAIDHGLESTKEREQKGKSPYGTISLQAKQTQSQVKLIFSDNGKGLNLQRLRQKAVELGLTDNADSLPDKDAANLIFYSGISTANKVSNISGRGVGLDAVKNFLTEHGGDIAIELISGGISDGRPFELHIILPSDVAFKV